MRTHVLVIGPTGTEKERIAIRKAQSNLVKSGAKAISILDFVMEGDEEPARSVKDRLLNIVYTEIRSVVYTGECQFHQDVKELAQDLKLQFIAARDIVFTGSNPFPYSRWERLEHSISWFFRNGRKESFHRGVA